LVTLLGGYPSLAIGPLLEKHHQDIGDILRESLAHESESCAAYYQLLELTQGKSVLLEDYARSLIVEEEMHADEVNKMLRRTGKTGVYEVPKS
ncbi:MAG TPA: ferritin-like domain-containing protein, partial [Nitrosospira sp.]|nr:ferritin-like domain-containing protein [Nitrosospira sp.]